MDPVPYSPELARIAALPRRSSSPAGSDRLSDVFRKTSSAELRPVQAQALAEILLCKGLLGPISVGAGKTLITYLAPHMVSAKRPVLLVPAKLREKTYNDFEALEKCWRGVKSTIVSYELLGRPQGVEILNQLEPDMIICDEAHRLKNVKAAVTKRVARWMSKHPETVFVALSGTLTSRSLMDFAHIAEWSLGQGAPVPLKRYPLETWCQALDEEGVWKDSCRDPGALEEVFGSPVREGYQRRLRETPGVVVSHAVGCSSSLIIDRWEPRVPEEITSALKDLYRSWETPDGQPIFSAADLWRHAREIALGFYYRWEPEPPKQWMEARRAWAAKVREILSTHHKLDSRGQVEKRFCNDPLYLDWLKVKDTYGPRTVPTWLTKDIIEQVPHEGIIWTEHTAVGTALQDLGLPYHGKMGKTWRGQDLDKAEGPVCCSIAACSEGRNLQRYHKNLVLCPPTTGDRWEQLIGRTHRSGQKEDTVYVDVYLGCHESRNGFFQAISDARYQHEISGESRKLLIADLGRSFQK